MATWKKVVLEGDQANIGDSNLQITEASRTLTMPSTNGSNLFTVPFAQAANSLPGSVALSIKESYNSATELSNSRVVELGNNGQVEESPTQVQMVAGKGVSLTIYGDSNADSNLGNTGSFSGSKFTMRVGNTFDIDAGAQGEPAHQRFILQDNSYSALELSNSIGDIEWHGPTAATPQNGNEIQKGNISMRNGPAVGGGEVDDVIFRVQAADLANGLQTVLEVGGSESYPPSDGASQTSSGWTNSEKKLQGSRLQETSLWALTNRFITSYQFGSGSASGSHPSPYTVGNEVTYTQRFLSNVVMAPPASTATGNGVDNRGFIQMRSGYLMGGSIQCAQNTLNDTDAGRVELHVNITHPTTGSETSYFVGSDTGDQSTYNSNYNINFAAQYSDIRGLYVPKGHIITPYLKVINGSTSTNFRVKAVIGRLEFYSEEMYPSS